MRSHAASEHVGYGVSMRTGRRTLLGSCVRFADANKEIAPRRQGPATWRTALMPRLGDPRPGHWRAVRQALLSRQLSAHIVLFSHTMPSAAARMRGSWPPVRRGR